MKYHHFFQLWFAVVALMACTVAGCKTSAPQTKDAEGRTLVTISCESPRKRAGYGPPPFEYWRIIGGTVPKAGFALESALDAPGPMLWTFVGPRPVTSEYWSGNANAGGRVASIACHPTNAALAYIGTASGGVWKTVDSGANWTPLTDAMPNLNTGAVRIDRNFPETIYAGTGEYVSGSLGDGLYRSLDGGLTWSTLVSSSILGSRCSGLEVISGTSATSPATIHWTGSSGYRRSTTGGNSWSISGLNADCSDLAVNRTDPQIVYVARRSSGIYKSTNGGTSFTLLSGGLPTTGFTRIVMSIAPSAPATLYAAFVSSSTSGLEGLYKTIDSGATWTRLTATPDFPNPQGSWDLSIGIDPTNANHLYCGGVSPVYQIAGVIESTNGGTSWTEISATGGQIHPDQQCIAFGANNVPWFGCDGGIWRRASGQWINCNATLAAIQNYTIAQHPSDPNRMMAGTQDNGSNGTATGSVAWGQLQAGDGGFGSYKASNYTTLFTTYVYLSIYRMVNTTQTNISGPWSGDSREWISPLVADANAPDTLLAGTNRVWRNTASQTTATWTAISDTIIADGGTITAIATVKGISNTIWVGNSRGGVWRTTDTGLVWTRVRTADNVRITTISTRPNSSSEAFISRDSSTGTRVMRTTNAATWTNMTGTLPANIIGKTLAVDWGRSVPTMYLGSGAGIYASFTLGASWVKNGTDLPNVNIGQLEIDSVRRTIIVGTYGRGAWKSSMPRPTDIDADGQIAGSDLTTLLAGWGSCPASGYCPADIDMNGVIDGADLTAVLSAWDVPLSINSVSPSQGSSFGGTPITITGTSLTGTTSVTVGGVAATSVVVVSSTSITAVTPAGTVGAKSVEVTTPSGTASAADAFTYVTPPTTISSVSPTSGSTAGGTAITITGTSLTNVTSVTVDGVAATSVVVVSSTSVTAVTPAGTVGAKNVVVTTPNGTASAADAFTYVTQPTISSISPTTGSTAGGTPITITGANLTGATSVTVGGVAATSVVVVWSQSVTAVTPAGTVGAKNIVVTTPNGTASAGNAFTYVMPTDGYTVIEQFVNAAVVTDATLRNAITASGLPWRVRDNGTNIEMLLVPAGTFRMGCSASTQYGCDNSNEIPTHQVTLTQAFYIGRYEVTQAQWTAKMGSNPSYFSGYSDSPSRPVEQVSWNMIASTGGFMSVTGLRLPTEAEWEYAYRAGTTTAFHSYPAQPTGFNNDILLGNIAWYYSNSGNQTHAVGGKLANALGLHDMSGNVYEWCQDWNQLYPYGSVTNPTGPSTGSYRMLRGGYSSYVSNNCRSSYRSIYTPATVVSSVGFRVARNP